MGLHRPKYNFFSLTNFGTRILRMAITLDTLSKSLFAIVFNLVKDLHCMKEAVNYFQINFISKMSFLALS